jgi:D-psicose/D-tagatose/L-ribulose 3-epimerase
MKHGAHCYLFTDRWADDQLGLLDEARGLGLDCWEIAVGDDVAFDAARARRRAEALGLQLIVSPGALWPRQHDLSAADPAQWQAALDWHLKQVELGARLGAVAYTGALYGHPGVLHYRPLRLDERRRIADGLRALAERGARDGVQIAIEPMSHFRTHVANTVAQALELVELAGHPNLKVLFDTYHLITEERDYGRALRACGDRLWGVHACENDRGAPGGGLVPWPAVFAALRDIGFDGYLILESYNSSIDGFAHGRGMLHDVCPDGPAFVRQSLRFLKVSVEARS